MFSARIENLISSPIRDILRIADQPNMVSFAGGLPDKESFPSISSTPPSDYMQYGPTEGEQALRERITRLMASRGMMCSAEQIILLNGSQQGIDLAGKLFIDSGNTVAIENPTYLAALQVFKFYGAQFSYIDEPSPQKHPALTYINPTFQNPTGRCYTKEQRQQIASHCDKNNYPLLEDDPYHDLDYDKSFRQPTVTYLKKAPWLYISSFSKTFAPGLRLGFMVCSTDLVPYISQLKQATDLHTNRISQYYVLQWLNATNYDQRLLDLALHYKNKRDHFHTQLSTHFSDLATWQKPQGGLFFWLKLKSEFICDTQQLLAKAIKNNLAFMPGDAFFNTASQTEKFLRLNFSNASQEQAAAGISLLAKLIRNSAKVTSYSK